MALPNSLTENYTLPIQGVNSFGNSSFFMRNTSSAIYILVFSALLLSACGSTKDYTRARTENTISAYKQYLKKHPKGKYAPEATQSIVMLFEQQEWNQVVSADTPEAYEGFMIKYPQSSHASLARQKYETLMEERSWKNALSANKISGFEDFMALYPNSVRKDLAKKKIQRIEEEQAWRTTKSKNTIVDYEAFLSNYPSSSHAPEANGTLVRLKDEQAWRAAQAQGTLLAYREYLNAFPNGKKRTEALATIREMEVIVPEWDKTLQAHTAEGYRNFIRAYPNTAYSALAESRLAQLEQDLWAAAKRKPAVRAYETYLATFPEGAYAGEARKAIIDLEVDAIFRGEHGALPPMDRANTGYSQAATNEINLYNNTQYTLTVRYSGLESHKIVLQPKRRTTLQLNNGSYRVTASVNAAHVTNYAGSETLEGGEYTSEFYIVTY